MDTDLQRLKQEIETGLGRPMDVGEEVETKALFYFAKGVELKNQLKSEPELLGDICKRVLENICDRMDRQSQDQRRNRIISAVGDFMRSPRSSVKRTSKERKLS